MVATSEKLNLLMASFQFMEALEMSWEARGKPVGVMFHSDSNNAYVSLYHHLVCRLTRLV